MIVCRSCGSQSADADAFCGSCGEFLEWAGEKLAQPAAPPVAEPHVGSSPRQPEAMQPQEPRRRPMVVAPAAAPRRLQAGDVICGDCGQGNPPERRFCSRCGGSLHAATPVPVPWWRRLLQRRRGVHQVGARPRRTGHRVRRAGLRALRGGLLRALVAAVLLAGLFYAVAPGVRDWVNDQVSSAADEAESLASQDYLPVRPISVTAVGEVGDHPATAATDGFNNTFWAAPDATAGPVLVLGFEQPVGLDRALVQVGGGEDFQAWGRPEQLHLVYSTGRTKDVQLEDTSKPQEVDLDGGDGVTSVEIQVRSVYRSVSNPGLAVSEIELFDRK